MSTTTKITDLPVLTSVSANSDNTVFVVVDKSSGTFTTKQVSLTAIDLAVDNVAPTALVTADAAFAKANAANVLAQAAFNAANTSQADATGAFAKANASNVLAQAAFNQANSGFDFANSANVLAQAAFDQANTANITADAGFAFANTVNVTAEAAYAWANTVNISVDSAYAFANTINIKTDAAFTFANTVNITADAAFAFANAANVLAQAAFDAANTANAGVVQGAYDQANTANITAQAAFDFANTINVVIDTAFAFANTINITADAAFVQANAANVLAQQAFDFANTVNTTAETANITAESAYAFANVVNLTADAAFTQANAANITAEAAFAFSNTINVKVDSSFAFANTVNVTADAAFAQANAANVLAQQAYDFANTVNLLGNDFITNAANTANAAFNFANSANVLAQAAFNQANTALTTAALSFNNSNTAETIALAGFGHANDAFNFANSANVLAQAAFDQANTPHAIANTANITADAAFVRANAANVLAQAAFNQANSVYLPSVTRLNVTNAGSAAYLFDQYSGNNSTLYITAGETIAFNLNVTGHPFMIRVSSGGTNYNTGLTHVATDGTISTDSSAQGQVTGTLYWKVPFELANTNYVYQCNVHSVMVGSIQIGQPNAIILTRAQAAFDAANAANTFANTISIKTEGAFTRANLNENILTTLTPRAAAAFDTANLALATASIAINYDNSANAAFDKANAANVLAQAAFDFANTIVSDTQIDPFARTQANAAFDQANSANVLAQASFNQANSVFLPSVTRLNVTNAGAGAFLFDQYTGNNATLYITAGETIAFNLNVTGHPFMIRETSGGANYNTGLTHVSTTGTVSTNAAAQGQVTGTLYWKVPAELASNNYVYQCAVHAGMVGTIRIGEPSAIVLTQANAAFDQANAANVLAQAAFDKANTGVNLFDQDLNTTDNVEFDEVTASNVFVESITLKANTLLAGDESKILSIPNSSGDGEGYTTLRLIPDDTIESFDQYLIIDPTQPTHIHIRAGGTQDDSNADLFLGGENSHFVVYAGLDPAVAITANNNTWAFNVDGTIQFPDSSTQTTAFTSNPTLDFTTTNVLKVEEGVQESYSNIANATGTVVHDCANGQIFYHTTPASNWTANFTNLQLTNGYATSLTLIISQGATGYIANSVLIDSSSTTIKWQGNTVPTPNVNSIDVVSFSVIQTGGNPGDVIVLGQLSTFG